MQIPPLANAKIVIRPFEPGDADKFVRAAHESIETVGTWMSWCTHSFTRDRALEWFATCDQDRTAGRAFDMGLFCAATGQLLGGAGINQLSPLPQGPPSSVGPKIASSFTANPLVHIYIPFFLQIDFCSREYSVGLYEVNTLCVIAASITAIL